MKEYAPRHTVARFRGWFGLFWAVGGKIAVFAAVVCVIATVISVISYRNAAQFSLLGVETQATVTDRWTTPIADGPDTFHVRLSFVVEEMTFGGAERVSEARFDAATVGSFQTVRYLPHAPERFEYYPGQSADAARNLQQMAGLAGVGSLISLWIFGRRTRRVTLTRQQGTRHVVTIDRVRRKTAKLLSAGHGQIYWKMPDASQGKSLRHPLAHVDGLAVGDPVIVYARAGQTVWEGDVGPPDVPKSDVPKVPRR